MASNLQVAVTTKIPVGISSCLLGERVRYDGGHKNDSYVRSTLGEYFEFNPFCPEVAIGLGVPRKPIRLTKTVEGIISCVSLDDDHTDALQDCANQQSLMHQQLCGYILKKNSPSCGMERVKVWNEGNVQNIGVGIYAKQLMTNYPFLPVEEEGRLGDAVLRENFIQRVFVLHRWIELKKSNLSVSKLIEFHARHKLILLSRGRVGYTELGRMIAGLKPGTLQADSERYIVLLMSALKLKTTRKNQVNVLQHIQGYLKSSLDKQDKQELVELIDSYRKAHVPLIVPITLLNHFFKRHPNDYIEKSWYMNPYPSELSLQNTI